MSSDPIPINRPARYTAGPDATQTAARIMLGRHVCDLREHANLTQLQVAQGIHVSNSTINRLESGKGKPERRTVEAVMNFFNVGGEERAELEALLTRALEPEWFQHRYSDCTPDYLRRLLGLEAMAISLMTYEARLVSGLLQTEDYTRSVIRTGLHLEEWKSSEMQLRVEQRRERQRRVFDQAQPPKCVFLMDESVLRRRVGSDDVMRAQMRQLREMADLSYVVLRFVLLDRLIAGNAGTMAGSMTHLQFGRGGLPDLVYVEGYEDAKYYSKSEKAPPGQSATGRPTGNDFERYLQLLLRVGGEACASPAESRRMLDSAIKRFSA